MAGGKSSAAAAEAKRNGGAEALVVRRRLIGALAMFALAAVLWQLGESTPPPAVRAPQTPAAEQWRPETSETLISAREKLAAGESVVLQSGDGTVISVAGGNDGELPPITPAPEVEVEVEAEAAPVAAAPQPQAEPEAAPEGKSFSAGVFSNKQNADALAQKMQAAGWQSSVRERQNESGKVLHQVMIVNLPDDVAVVAAKQQLAQLLKQPARQQQQKPAAAAAQKEKKQESPFVVQVGAFSNPALAQNILQKLKDKNYAARIEETNRNGAILYRVRAVGYKNRAAAEQGKRDLRQLGHKDAQVVDLR